MAKNIFDSLNKINRTISTVDMVQGTAQRVGGQITKTSGLKGKSLWLVIAVVAIVILYFIFT